MGGRGEDLTHRGIARQARRKRRYRSTTVSTQSHADRGRVGDEQGASVGGDHRSLNRTDATSNFES